MRKRLMLTLFALVAVVTLSACGNNHDKKFDINNNVNLAPDDNLNIETQQSVSEQNHIDHSNTGIVPNNIIKAENPTYQVGSRIIINANHMKGMQGAKGTVVGAYDTIAYTVSYKPTTGGEEVKNHKWVIQEEIKKPDDVVLAPGAKVTLEADHMPGMKGAIATIDTGRKTTVYMVNYKPTNGGKEVKNHKWVIESELSSEK
ncbi:YdhK family protein [Rummeliibacillus sp. JY-2-4R]